MTLEDHVGDVLAKARAATGVGSMAAAQAAGLSSDAYQALEEQGKAGRVDWVRLGAALGLDGERLGRLAEGWMPPVMDLSLWRELRQITTKGPKFSVNCYLIWDEVTREAALFDTGFEATEILRWLDVEKLQLKHIFITHSHYDHIEALPQIRERFPKVRLHTSSKNAPPEHRNRANDFIHLGSLRISNRETTGHAEDGVSYVVGNWPEDAPGIVVVGDAIFAGSMGSARELTEHAKQKIRDQIFTLPGDTLICPGHGPVTTVETERAHNPFFGPRT